jgi:hypothetical protein
MIGVGVLYHSNMYPAHYDMWNKAGWTYWRIWKIIYIPYWQIYGEPNLEIFEGLDFRGEDFLGINQSETRIACGGHIC